MYQKKTKRKQQAMQTKENILNVATALFKKNGFENTTVEEITGKAGISTGTFYYYFRSKEELIYEWVKQLDEIYEDFYEKEVCGATADQVPELIRKKIFLVLENYSRWGHDVVSISYSYMMRNEELKERMTSGTRICYQISSELFTKGQTAGIIRSDLSIDDLIQSNVRLERGALIDWCIQGGKSDILKDNENNVRIYLDGIKTH